MDIARQIIRWSIPGSIFQMVIAGTYVLIALCAGNRLERAVAPISNNLSPAAAIGLAVPLGFIIYQVYFVYYTPRRFLGLVAGNRGIEILNCFTAEQRDRIEPWLQRIADDRPDPKYSQDETELAVKEIEWSPPGKPKVLAKDVLGNPWLAPPLIGKCSMRTRVLRGNHLLAPDRDRTQAQTRLRRAVRRARNAIASRVTADAGEAGLTRFGRVRAAAARAIRDSGARPYRWHSGRQRKVVGALYRDRWVAHATMAWVLFDVSSLADGSQPIRRAAEDTADIYHGLGASRLALAVGGAIGAFGYFGRAILRDDSPRHPVRVAVAVLVVVVGVIVCIALLSQARARWFKQSAIHQGYGLSALYAADERLFKSLESASAHTRHPNVPRSEWASAPGAAQLSPPPTGVRARGVPRQERPR